MGSLHFSKSRATRHYSAGLHRGPSLGAAPVHRMGGHAWHARSRRLHPRRHQGDQLFLHHYRSPRTGECPRRQHPARTPWLCPAHFAWLCRSGSFPPIPPPIWTCRANKPAHLPKFLSEQEILRLFTLPNPSDPFGLRDRTILELFYATGVRRTEMTQLDLGDYDPSTRTLLVRKGKNGKSRLLPVGERAAWWLDLFLADTRPLLTIFPARPRSSSAATAPGSAPPISETGWPDS